MKVAIVGAGRIGATVGYTLLVRGSVSELALVCRNRANAFGEALDMAHAIASAGRPIKVYSGDLRACQGAAVVVVAAGAPTMKGQSRLAIARDNALTFRELIPQIVKYSGDAIILVVTNPVDVATYLAIRYSGLPPNRVFGSGTVLDCQRFQSLLSRHFDVDPASVQAIVIGEHGDSMIPVWSHAAIAGIPLTALPEYDRDEMADIFEMTRRGAAMVRATKDATHFATALSINRTVAAILEDRKEVLTVSSLITDYHGIDGVCLSLPAAVGKNGIERLLRIPLSSEEEGQLKASAGLLKEVIASVADIEA